jgi:hypothetical protein
MKADIFLEIIVLHIVGLNRWRMPLVLCRMCYTQNWFFTLHKAEYFLFAHGLEIQASGSLERGTCTWSRPLLLFKKSCGLTQLVWAPNIYGTSSTINSTIFLMVISAEQSSWRFPCKFKSLYVSGMWWLVFWFYSVLQQEAGNCFWRKARMNFGLDPPDPPPTPQTPLPVPPPIQKGYRSAPF